VVEHQLVNIAGKIFCADSSAGVRSKVVAADGHDVGSALIHKSWRGGNSYAAINQCIPPDIEVIKPRSFVTEIAVWSPAALAVILRADHHIHAAIEDDVYLVAHRQPTDRGVADHWNQKA